MNSRLLTLTATLPLWIPALAVAQTVTFEVLPQTSTAMDLSPDGRWLVGSSDIDGNGFPDGTYIMDLTTNTMMSLPATGLDATSVSDDGAVVLGCMPDPGDGVEVAGMWTQATGWQSLGWLPDSLNCPSRSNGYELSGDGTVAVGLSWDGCSGRGFWWTEATGMLELEPMANGGNRATVVSSDGTVIGGFAQGSFSRTPSMWDGDTLAGTLLDPPDGDVVGEVQGMSNNGAILLGNWDGDAYMYTEANGVQIIGDGSVFPLWIGYAMHIADNGMIVGFDGLNQARQAWVKAPREDSMVTLVSYILDHGGTIPPGVGLGVAMRISEDGRTIVGHTFFQTAWKVTIEYCVEDVNSSGNVDVDDLLALLGAWGGDGPGADIADPIDVVDVDDLLGLLAKWGPCSP